MGGAVRAADVQARSAWTRMHPVLLLRQADSRLQMASVCKLLGGLQGGSKLQLFPTPKGSLGDQTRLDALEVLKFAAVRRDAHGFAEQ